jgi:cytosolic 5'-nucleotidase 3
MPQNTPTIPEFLTSSPESLQVLTDFDGTLTKELKDGVPAQSIISVLRNKAGYLDEDYQKKAHELYEKYHATELDKSLSPEEIKAKMFEWWTQHFDLLIQKGLNRKDIEQVASSGIIELREGAKEFLHQMNKQNIPVVIMSASGLGDAIPLFMQSKILDLPNILYAVNRMVFDSLGKAIDYEKPVIHSHNKDETLLSNFPEIYKKIAHRTNVLLLGNSVGDSNMADGFTHEALLKIAFLDKEDPSFEKKHEKMSENFDQLITDGTFKEFI